MASGRLVDYLGRGDETDLPVSLDLTTGAVGFYYAEDTKKLFAWDGAAWEELLEVGAVAGYTIVTEPSTFTADPGTHDGLTTLTLAGGDVTFSDSEPYTEGMTFNIRATSPIELLEDSVTLDPPAGGTLELDAGMAVQVVFTGATTAVVIGQTAAA